MPLTLAAPENVVAEPRDNAVRVKWDPVEGADGYMLFFFKEEKPRVCIKRRYAQKTTKQVLGFFNGEKYLVAVRAFYYEDGKECEGETSKKIPFTPISMDLKAQNVLCMTTGEVAQLDWEYRNTRPYALFYAEDEDIVDVDRNGIVRALAPGRTEIAIVAEGQEISTKVYVDRGQTMAQAKAVMMFTGDLMCAVNHQRVCSSRQFDFHDSFNPVRKILKEADFSVGVLETTCYDPVPYEYEQLRLDSGAPNCNSPSSFLTAVAEAGFDMVVTANNHSCDTGYEGLVATVESVKQLGMYNLGALGDNPVFRDINGIRVAFIAFTMISNGHEKNIPEITPDTRAEYSREYFQRMYDLARGGGAEYVVAYQHWGSMNSKTVKEKQIQESQFMALCGVDLIVGSHPHMIQEFRYVTTPRGRRVPCAYSLGNFISSQAELNENRDSVILRVELFRAGDEIEADISYIPCMSANSECGVTVHPVDNFFNDASKLAYARIKETMGEEIEPFEYRPEVLLSGSVILEKIFDVGSFARVDKYPLLLSQLTACNGEPLPTNGMTTSLELDVGKGFAEYLRNSDADYIAVDFYTAAAVSCYERNGTLYTGTNRFLKSNFYNKRKDEFTRIKPPYEEKFWKPLIKKYAEEVLSEFPSERIILFRQYFPDKFVKGGTELRSISLRSSLNEQIAEMEEYFIALTDPSVVNISHHYFTAGSSPSNYEQYYFNDAYGAAKKIIRNNRRCVDTPDPDIWMERVLNCYENMIARSFQSWLLDMNNAADVIIAYTSKEFTAANKSRLLKLKKCGTASLGKIPSFFADDPGATELIAVAKLIRAVLSGDMSRSYSFYAPAFEGKFSILKKMAKLLSEEVGAYVSAESAERVFLLKNKPEQLEHYLAQLRERTADIWGSCISKEVFNYCKNSGIGRYIFKQCPVLAYDKPVPAEVPEDLSLFKNNAWRRRTIADSFARAGLEQLKEEHSKWLVIDLYDVICNMNEYKGRLFEVDGFIRRTDFYRSIENECEPCYLFDKFSKEECRDLLTSFAWEMMNLYGNNIVLIKADLKDNFVNLQKRIEKMEDDPVLERKREFIAFCEDIFIKQTDCAVIDIAKHFYASDKFPLGGADPIHYEHEFYREAGVFLAHILSSGKQRKFTKADESYISMRNLRLER